jgi:hypothetical protein
MKTQDKRFPWQKPPLPPIDVKMSVQELEPNEIDVYDVAKTSTSFESNFNLGIFNVLI